MKWPKNSFIHTQRIQKQKKKKLIETRSRISNRKKNEMKRGSGSGKLNLIGLEAYEKNFFARE